MKRAAVVVLSTVLLTSNRLYGIRVVLSTDLESPQRRLGNKKGYWLPDYPSHKHGKGFFDMYPPVAPPAPVPQFIPVPVPAPQQSVPDVPAQQTYPNPDAGSLSSPSTPEYRKKQYVVTVDGDYECPDGYTLTGDICIKQDQMPSKLGCREGWRFKNGVCFGVDTLSAEYICPTGFEQKDHECVKEVIAPKQMLCPKGFSIGKEGCVQNTNTHVDYICEDGFDKTGDRCVKTTTTEPTAECPLGMQYLNGMCKRETMEIGKPSCPSGYQLVNGECILHDEEPAELRCPAGFDLHGTECAAERRASPALECSSGAYLRGDQCFRRSSVPASFQCPPNSQLNVALNICEQNDVTAAQAVCPKYYSLDGQMCIKIKSMMQGKSKAIMMKKKEKHEHVSHMHYSDGHVYQTQPKMVCPGGYSLAPDGHSCTMKGTHKPIPQCIDGYTYDGTSCFKEVCLPADVNCPSGFELLDNDCVAMEVVSAKADCGKPGYLLQHGYCINTKRTSMKVLCPSGYTNSENGCQKVEVMKPSLICPPGMRIDAQSSSSHDHHYSIRRLIGVPEMCVGEMETRPIPSCPHGFELNNESRRNPECVGKRVGEPRFVCPETFHEGDGKCVKYNTGLKRPTCPEGFKFSFGQCIKKLDERPVVLCPVGYKLFNTVCVAEMTTKPIPICPPQYRFDALTGRCYKVEVQFDYADERPEEEDLLPLTVRDAPEEEDILDLSQPDTTTTTPMPPATPPMEAMLPQAPPQVTVIQQPVPIPQPMLMLPRQAPMPRPPPPPPAPMAIPMPYPVERVVEREVPVVKHHTKVVREVVPVHHTKVVKVPMVKKKKNRHH